MPLEVRRELKLGDIKVVIEPEQDPKYDFLAYIAFREDKDDGGDYGLPISPEQWQTLKGLIDETFRHMQTYIERLPDEDKDEDDE